MQISIFCSILHLSRCCHSIAIRFKSNTKRNFQAEPFLLLFQLFDSVVQSRADLQKRSNKSYTQIANSRHEHEMKLNWHNKYTLITVCTIKHHLKWISIEKEAGRVYLFVQKWDNEICRWLEINFFEWEGRRCSSAKFAQPTICIKIPSCMHFSCFIPSINITPINETPEKWALKMLFWLWKHL